MLPELSTDYYLHNFLHLLEFVASRYSSLLNDHEQDFYRRFQQSPTAAQQLYIRLLSRKGSLFLSRKLNYPEIDSVARAATGLTRSELLDIDPRLELAQLLPLFTKADLASKLDDPAINKAPRPLTEEKLLANPDQAALCQCLTEGEVLYQTRDEQHFRTFQLCFFGNLRQDLTDYVLRDLGLQRYENYSLDQDSAPFHQRAQIDQHLAYYQCVDRLDEALAGGVEAILALFHSLPEPPYQDPTAKRRIERTTNTLARQLERLDAPELALELYRQTTRPPSRERRARILIKRGDIDEGLQLCHQIAEQSGNEEERIFAQEFGSRSARKHGRSWPKPTRYQPPEQLIELTPSQDSVEIATAAYYAAEGPCFFVENSLVNGMLGLLIWDIVFAPMVGAFYNPFQSAPADFYEPGFPEARRELLDRRLQEIDDPARMKHRIRAHWQAKHGLRNPLVHWDRLSADLIELAMERIPGAHWRALFSRSLQDLRYHRSGLPDLVLFPAEGGYRLIEVKAPGDRLQKNQQRWMQFFANQSIPHLLAHIRWADR